KQFHYSLIVRAARRLHERERRRDAACARPRSASFSVADAQCSILRRPRARSNRLFEEFRTIAETKAARSLLWFAPIQRIERKQDATRLASQVSLIAAEPIKREIG